MIRRDLYQFVEELRHTGGPSRWKDPGDFQSAMLNAFRVAMYRRRGRPIEPIDGEAALLPFLDRPDVAELLDQDDVLGRVYQALNAPALEKAYRGTARDRRKFADEEIPAVSQLFTPRWVVQFLLHNTLGRLWMQWHPPTRLRRSFSWLIEPVSIPSDPGTPPKLPPISGRRASDIRLLDPACGTMNFGLVAFEMLADMYREELDHAGERGWPAEPSEADDADIPTAILRNNIHGIDIDPIALNLARASLELKSGVDCSLAHWNFWQADSLMDEEIARRFNGEFDVVVTNPPYISARNLPPGRVAQMKKRFPAAWRDLYACFIDRSVDFARQGGRVGLLAMQSFMFTGSYERLRLNLSEQTAIETLAHFGPGLFGIGNPGTLQTVAFVAKKEADAQARAATRLSAFRLTDIPANQKESELHRAVGSALADASHRGSGAQTRVRQGGPCYSLPQSTLSDLPRRSWAYWVDAPMRRAFRDFPRLADIAPPRQGLATTDNFRFVRYWWEVEKTHPDAPASATAGRWAPYVKSGRFRRWYEAPRHRVNWQDDGREIKKAIVDRYPYLNGQWKWVAKNTSYYGRPGVTWSYLTSGRFSARRLEAGAVFDVAGSSLFPQNVPGMLSLLNSSVVHRLLQAINPTVNFQVGDLAELPIPGSIPAELGVLGESAIRLQQELDSFDETTIDFTAPMPWENAIEQMRSIQGELATIERTIDASVGDLYGAGPQDSDPKSESFDLPAVELPSTPAHLADLARRWVSFAVGILLGRWNGARPGRVLQLDPVDRRVIADVREVLESRVGGRAAAEIDATVGGIDTFLARGFFSWHVLLHRKRPPLWALGTRGRMFLLAHDAATRDALAPIVRAGGIGLPTEWERNVDDGIALGLTPLRSLVPDAALRRDLDKIAGDASEGRFPWMQARPGPTLCLKS